MSAEIPPTGLQLRSLITASGELKLSLEEMPVERPNDDEVLIRVEATPINPSDLGLLLGPADLTTAVTGGTPDRPTLTAEVPERFFKAMQARLDQSLPVGNEGAGVVIEAGANARGLLGKTVAAIGGAMYAQYRTVRAADCLLLPDGATAADGASCFVNPLTALGMVETMRRGRAHRARPYRRRLQPRSDAEQDLHRRRRLPCEHRPNPRTGRDPARDRRRLHL